MATSIKTNRQWREPTCWLGLPAKVQADFDYLSEDEKIDERFVCYRGWWYDVYDTMRAPESLAILGWDSYSGDSYFSGVLFRLDNDGRVMCGTYIS